LLPAILQDTSNTHNTQNISQTNVEQLKQSLIQQPAWSAQSPHSALGNSNNNGTSPASTEDSGALPALYFTCFGSFEVKRHGQPVALCANRNGQATLRYLAAQANHRASMDTLIALWRPDDDARVGHHKLPVTIRP